MNEAKRQRLAAAGFHSTTVADFLGLSVEQSELIEIKLAFTSALKKQRIKNGLSQSQLADKIGSSQSRVAKMESGDPHVSLDLMMRALVAAGMTRNEIGEVLSSKHPVSPQNQMPQTHLQNSSQHYTFTTRSQRPNRGDSSDDRKVFGA